MCSERKLVCRWCQWFFGSAALILAALALGIIGSASASAGKTAVNLHAIGGKQMASVAVNLQIDGQLPSFSKGGECLNSKPLTSAERRGKVVLINYWSIPA